MLTTLRDGVRGGKWYTLIDKVYSPDNLFFAARRVVYRKGASGDPYAGKRPVRFGGRGDANQCDFSTPVYNRKSTAIGLTPFGRRYMSD